MKAQLQKMMARMVEWKQVLEAKIETSSCKFQSIISGPIGQLQQTPNAPSTPPSLTRPAVNLQHSSATIANNNESESVEKHHIEDTKEVEVSKIVEVEMATDNGPHKPIRPTNHLTLNPHCDL